MIEHSNELQAALDGGDLDTAAHSISERAPSIDDTSLAPVRSRDSELTTGVEWPIRNPLPWPRNTLFTGRDPVLAKMESHFLRETSADTALARFPSDRDTRQESSEPRSYVLSGLAGTGKTQIALEYIHRFSAMYDVVFWLPACDKSRLEAALTDCAARLHPDTIKGAGDDKQDLDLFRKWLARTSKSLSPLHLS